MIVVYTAIFGGSDSLKPAPAGADRAVVFTDDVALCGAGWEVAIRPEAAKPRRAARVLKMSPHELFPEASCSIWVDGSIAIRDLARIIVDAGDADVACFAHPDRSTCYDEGKTVVRLKIAHQRKVAMALELYRRDGFAPTSLSTTGLFYRRHSPTVRAFNELWREHLDRFGTNDQVHVDYCAWKTGARIRYLEGHYRDNPFAVYDRLDHHRRRRPQFLPDREETHYLA